MKPYRLIRKLVCSKDLNKDIAVKFDAGKVSSHKYGEATLAGHLLLINRHGEFPTVNVEQIEERACSWLNEMGLKEYHHEVLKKINLPAMVAYSAPVANPERLGLYFKLSVVIFLLDEVVLKLDLLNANNQIQLRQDITRLVRSLISIIEKKNGSNLEVADSINPTFEAFCRGFSHFCSNCFQQMNEDEYAGLAKELVDHVKVHKWMQEYRGSPYTENDYLFLRSISFGWRPLLYSICLAQDICISNEIITHPLFQRYNQNAILHIALSNDIISLQNEIADNEAENIVLVKCNKYSLQKSFHKTEEAINELLIDLKKDEIKLKLYFPADDNLQNFIKTIKYAIDGFQYWYQHSRRYGNIKFENYVVEYDNDYFKWLEKISVIGAENMEEPVLRVKSNSGGIILSPIPLPGASNL